jgi:hypothetical protein
MHFFNIGSSCPFLLYKYITRLKTSFPALLKCSVVIGRFQLFLLIAALNQKPLQGNQDCCLAPLSHKALVSLPVVHSHSMHQVVCSHRIILLGEHFFPEEVG